MVGVAAEQVGLLGDDELAAAEHADLAQHARHQLRHRRLARARAAQEDHVHAAALRDEAGHRLAATLVHLEHVEQLPQVRLDTSQADHPVEVSRQHASRRVEVDAAAAAARRRHRTPELPPGGPQPPAADRLRA